MQLLLHQFIKMIQISILTHFSKENNNTNHLSPRVIKFEIMNGTLAI